MHSWPSLLRSICQCGLLVLYLPQAVFGQFGNKQREKSSVISEEVKYITCDVCHKLVEEAFVVGDSLRENAPTISSVGEVDIIEKLQYLCMPDEEAGKWITHLDLVESKRIDLEEQGEAGSVILGADKKGFIEKAKKNNFLLIRDWGMRGQCKEECVTIAKACQDNMDETVDMDALGIEVWKGATTTAKERKKKVKTLCSDACSGKRKMLSSKGRKKDFTWLMMSDQEIQMEALMSTMEAQGLGGNVYNPEDMMNGDPYGDGGAYNGGYGDAYGMDDMAEL